MGDRLRHCCDGINALCGDGDVDLIARSKFYETEPVDYLNQDWFLNAAVKIATELTPMALLSRLQAIQSAVGRKTGGVRFGPRVLDLDILIYDDLILSTSRLIIPHPRMHKRRFVLQPICDIDPNIVHPRLGMAVRSLLDQLDMKGQRIRPCSFDC